MFCSAASGTRILVTITLTAMRMCIIVTTMTTDMRMATITIMTMPKRRIPGATPTRRSRRS